MEPRVGLLLICSFSDVRTYSVIVLGPTNLNQNEASATQSKDPLPQTPVATRPKRPTLSAEHIKDYDDFFGKAGSIVVRVLFCVYMVTFFFSYFLKFFKSYKNLQGSTMKIRKK